MMVAADATRRSSACNVPAQELGSGMSELQLRVTPTRNNQRIGVRYATNYLEI